MQPAVTDRSLPFAIDELQVLNNKRLAPENVIYVLSQGQCRIRGGKDGGLQETLFWRNIILTTGEEALISGNSQDGAETRTIELYGQPVDNLADAAQIHEVAEQNYGCAGKTYMDGLISMIASKPDILAEDYKLIHDRLWAAISGSLHLDEATVVALGDYYSSRFVFRENESEARTGSIQTALDVMENNRQLTQRDNVSRAWDMLVGWILANESRFHSETSPPRYGRIDDKGYYLMIRAFADKALEDAGFSPEKSFRGFLDRGWIKASTDPSGIKRLAVAKSIDGKSVRVYVVVLPTVEGLT